MKRSRKSLWGAYLLLAAQFLFWLAFGLIAGGLLGYYFIAFWVVLYHGIISLAIHLYEFFGWCYDSHLTFREAFTWIWGLMGGYITVTIYVEYRKRYPL